MQAKKFCNLSTHRRKEYPDSSETQLCVPVNSPIRTQQLSKVQYHPLLSLYIITELPIDYKPKVPIAGRFLLLPVHWAFGAPRCRTFNPWRLRGQPGQCRCACMHGQDEDVGERESRHDRKTKACAMNLCGSRGGRAPSLLLLPTVLTASPPRSTSPTCGRRRLAVVSRCHPADRSHSVAETPRAWPPQRS